MMIRIVILLSTLFKQTYSKSLFECNFDNGICGLNNSGVLPWEWRSGSTPSGSTGPTSDHTTGSGYYMYMESSSPNYPEKGPFILSAQVDAAIGIATFWYSMYGTAIGTLSLDVSDDGDIWTTKWTKSGEQGTDWKNATVDIDDTANYFRFYGITGSDYTGDIAIDDVNITARITAAPSVTPAPSISSMPTHRPTSIPSPSPSTIGITTDTQLVNHAITNATVEIATDIALSDYVTLDSIDNLVINGNGFKIYSTGLFRCFLIEYGSLTFYDMTVSQGYASAYGGAFMIQYYAKVTIERCIIENSVALAAAGGGIYVAHSAVLTLVDSIVRSNTAANGGGMRVNGAYPTTTFALVFNTSFIGNIATDAAGGGIVVSDNGAMTLQGGSIRNNVAAGDGGGVACYSAHVKMFDVEIKENSAESGGGLMFDSSTVFNMSNFKLTENQATRGGGFFSGGSYTEVTLQQGYIGYNQAIGDSGGGGHVASGYVSVANVEFEGNAAIGSVFNTFTGSCVSRGGCFFSGNYPSDYDVDEYCEYSAGANGTLVVNSFNTEADYDFLHIDGVLYDGRVGPECVDVHEGEVILWASDSALVSSGFQICYSVTSSGGGMHLVGGTSYISNCSFIQNNATRNGGALNLDGGTAVVEDAAVLDNIASAGTAIYITSGNFEARYLTLNGDFNGVSAESAVCASPCQSGEYGNCSVAEGASDCYVNCECVKCEAGYYSSTSGSVSVDDCSSCGAGQVSSEGAASCTSCALGKYATDSVDDKQGGLLKQVSSGATSCNDCPAGYFTDTKATLVCQACSAGEFSEMGASSCTDCSAGWYSSGGSANCTSCASGFYGASAGLSSCVACAAGTYQASQGQDECVDCAAGKAQGATGQDSCVDCDVGSFSSETGASVCSNCDSVGSGFTSKEGSASCDFCLSEYYLDPIDGVCRECDSNSVCPTSSGSLLPAPNLNYWIDTHSLSSFGGANIDMYRCPRLTCKGGTPEDSSCWLSSNLTTCSRDKLLCTDGATGPLCGACGHGYVYSSADRICITCRDSITRLIGMVTAGLVLACIVVVIKVKKIELKCWTQSRLGNACEKIDSGPGRVMWTNYQIIQSVSWSLDISLPYPFSSMVGGLSFVSFDFLTLKCFEADYLLAVILWSLFPIVICVINFMIYSFRLSKLQASSLWMSFNDKTDTSISANFGNVIFIGIYLSVPMLWMFMLYKKRDKIRSRKASQITEVDQSMILRNTHKAELAPLKLLFSVYKPSLYYFEALEIYRRILFVGVIPLVSIRPARRAAVGVVLGLVSAITFRELDPFVLTSTNLLAYVACYTVVLTFGAALAIDTNLNRNFNNTLFGVMLVVVNLLVVALAFVLGARRAMEHSRGGWQNRVLTSAEYDVVQKIMGERKDSSWQEKGRDFALRDSETSPSSSDQTQETTTQPQEQPAKLEQYLIKPEKIETMKKIGAGAFGEVFKGRYDGNLVAIKTVIDVTDNNLRSFREEILLTASLKHPNIVNFVGACWARELICLVLEWVPKGSMQQLLDEGQDLRWEDPLLRLCTDIARGMVYLHSRRSGRHLGVLHRDLKPENILVSDFLSGKISDFGTSRNKAESDNVMMTAVGTPLFCAPEVMRGEVYNDKVDVYAFGMILMTSATDKPILDFIKERFDDCKKDDRRTSLQIKSQMRIIRPMIESEWRPVTKEMPIQHAPDCINDLIIRCIHPSPSERPSYRQILSELERALSSMFDGQSFSRCARPIRATILQAEDVEVDDNSERRMSENPMLHGALKARHSMSKTNNNKKKQTTVEVMTELTNI